MKNLQIRSRPGNYFEPVMNLRRPVTICPNDSKKVFAIPHTSPFEIRPRIMNVPTMVSNNLLASLHQFHFIEQPAINQT